MYIWRIINQYNYIQPHNLHVHQPLPNTNDHEIFDMYMNVPELARVRWTIYTCVWLRKLLSGFNVTLVCKIAHVSLM